MKKFIEAQILALIAPLWADEKIQRRVLDELTGFFTFNAERVAEYLQSIHLDPHAVPELAAKLSVLLVGYHEAEKQEALLVAMQKKAFWNMVRYYVVLGLIGLLAAYVIVMVRSTANDAKAKAVDTQNLIFHQATNEKGEALVYSGGDKKGQPVMANRFDELGGAFDGLKKSFADYTATAPTKTSVSEQISAALTSHQTGDYHTDNRPTPAAANDSTTPTPAAKSAAASSDEDLPSDLQE